MPNLARRTLFWKYAAYFSGLVSALLILSGGVSGYFAYRLSIASLESVQRELSELREKLERYQEQAADVLYAAFLGEFGIIEPGRSQSEYGLTPAEQHYQQAQLLANVARQQLAIEQEVGAIGEQVIGQQVPNLILR